MLTKPNAGMLDVQFRERLTAPRTYYIRPDGNDLNDGLANTAGQAWLTLQGAWNYVSERIDLGGQALTLQLADGTYAGFRDLERPIVGGRLRINGNSGSPGNTLISYNTGDCVEVSDSHVKITNVRITNSGGSCLHAYRTGLIEVGEGVTFGPTSEAHFFADNQGQIIAYNPYSIDGGGPMHWLAHTGGYIGVVTRTVTLIGTPAFSSGFAIATIGGIIEAADNTYVGSATGRRFAIENGGILQTNGSTTILPGNAAGTLLAGFYNNSTSV